jgi:hypothetical protein
MAVANAIPLPHCSDHSGVCERISRGEKDINVLFNKFAYLSKTLNRLYVSTILLLLSVILDIGVRVYMGIPKLH